MGWVHPMPCDCNILPGSQEGETGHVDSRGVRTGPKPLGFLLHKRIGSTVSGTPRCGHHSQYLVRGVISTEASPVPLLGLRWDA